MKKNLIKLFAVALGIFISITTTAQLAEEKLKVADLTKIADKEKTKPTNPDLEKEIAQQKVLTANDLPKPIVPGGEFKPMDTRNVVLPDEKKVVTQNHQPVIPPVSKSPAPPPPVVKEINPDGVSQQKAKPVSQVLKEQ